jgi:hypothetical protein
MNGAGGDEYSFPRLGISETKNQKWGIKGQKSEARSQRSEVGSSLREKRDKPEEPDKPEKPDEREKPD